MEAAAAQEFSLTNFLQGLTRSIVQGRSTGMHVLFYQL